MKIKGWNKLKGKIVHEWMVEEAMQFPLDNATEIYMLKFHSGASSFLTMVCNSEGSGFDVNICTNFKFYKTYSMDKEDIQSTDTFINKLNNLIAETIVEDEIKQKFNSVKNFILP